MQSINFIIIPHKIEDIVVEYLGDLLIEQFENDIKVIKYLEEDFVKGY